MLLYIKFTKAGYFNLKTKTVKITKYNPKSGYLSTYIKNKYYELLKIRISYFLFVVIYIL